MNNKTYNLSHLFGAVAVIALGVPWHFLYEWTGSCPAVGAFAPVNESIWEHLKLLFFPFIIVSVIEFFIYGKNYRSFVPFRTASVALGMGVIVAAYYTYSGIVGNNYLAADIAVFVLGTISAYCLSHTWVKRGGFGSTADIIIAAVVLGIFTTCFIVFTFCPPGLAIFVPPV